MKVCFEGDAEGVSHLRIALSQANSGNAPSLYMREVVNDENPDYRVLAQGGRYLIAKPDDELPLGWAKSQNGTTRVVLERLPQSDYCDHVSYFQHAQSLAELAAVVRSL